MNIELIREYCLSKKGVTESFPFNEDTLVFKVIGKMFALTNLEGELSINLKCKPDKAIELREQYTAIQPGYHMNKKHWITVYIDGFVSDNIIFQLIDDSYNLVINKFTKIQKKEFELI